MGTVGRRAEVAARLVSASRTPLSWRAELLRGALLCALSQVDAVEPVEVAVDSGAATGAEPAGAGSGGTGSGGAEPGGAEPGVTEPGGAESTRVFSRGASSRREVLSPQELREWFARRWSRAAGWHGSSCEAEIYAGAMAGQELRWLTYLLTDLGEQPRSPPVLYVDNKAMLALCREHRLEHRTKHIALRYFLSRELQQRGQLRLAYVASEANTADIFTKALAPGDHQRFCTLLGLVPTWPHLLTS
ncbi:unnamed protein product [Closterium sp. NIES-53]